MSQTNLWTRYSKYLYTKDTLGLMIDISRMNFNEDYLKKMEPLVQKAFAGMDALESGVIANPDENRMVGHYWLRNPGLAPTAELKKEIEETLLSVKDFAKRVHEAAVVSEGGKPFKNLLVIGIGGSALGPQFVSNALTGPSDKMMSYFFDNTDPDGMDTVLSQIGDGLGETLSVVISKSGGTAETRNGMLEAKAAYSRKGLNFARHAVAVTGVGSNLDLAATKEGWIQRFPMWDWVGGRTSVTSAVGMLPAALQGFDIDSLLQGARLCDEATRTKDTLSNPSAILALMWHFATKGRGALDMVILPYKDRLSLFTKYLQQLIMESLGKELDLTGRVVSQGITVYGNKGSTDQHAYVQQLRDGVHNFFVTFVEVLKDREGTSLQVEQDITSGDYLSAFLLGTRTALYGNQRESVTVTIERMDPFRLGVLIALYERTTGFYATLVNINAYHQPGVEAGKKAAGYFLSLQKKSLDYLRKSPGAPHTAEDTAVAIGAPEETEAVFKILLHAAYNVDHKVALVRTQGKAICSAAFKYTG